MDLTGLGSVADFAGKIIDKIFPNASDKEKAQLALMQEINNRDAAIINAQKEVMIAELTQSDSYTKRARPTIIYVGLFATLANYVVFPIITWTALQFSGKIVDLPTLAIPTDFWLVWGGVCGLYVWKRSEDKKN